MDKFCRICLRADDFRKFDISTISQISGIRIEDMLVYCTQLDVTSKDSLPQQICDECLAALSACFAFKKLCFRAETSIREMLKNQATEMQPEPSLEYELSLLDAEGPDASCPEAVVKPESSQNAAVADEPTVAEPELTEPTTVECVPSSSSHQTTTNSSPSQEKVVVVSKDGKMRFPRMIKYKTMLGCNQCDYKSGLTSNFHRHQKSKNHIGFKVLAMDEKPLMKRVSKLYRCNVCNFRTINRANFSAHQIGTRHLDMSTTDIKVDHYSRTKTKTCPHCGNNFINMGSHKRKCRARLATATAQDDDATSDYIPQENESIRDSPDRSISPEESYEEVSVKVEHIAMQEEGAL